MFPFPLRKLDRVNSTNTYLEDLLLSTSELEEFLVIYSLNQVSGKGQGTNKWYSTPYQNIHFSLLLSPSFLDATDQFYLNMLVSIGMVKFVKKILPNQNVRIKWPNDIYVGEKKLAGILIKLFIQNAKIKEAIVGVGLNVNEVNFPDNIPNPISLKQISGVNYEVENLIKEVLSSISLEYELLSKGSLVNIKKEYLSLLYRYNEIHTFEYKNQILQGKIIGVSEFGQLELQTQKGKILVCNMGDVKFII